MITHRYGRDGQNSKKFEDKALCFELTFFKTLVDPNFIEQYKQSLSTFVDLLNKNNKTGQCQQEKKVFHRGSFIPLLFFRFFSKIRYGWRQGFSNVLDWYKRSSVKTRSHFWAL